MQEKGNTATGQPTQSRVLLMSRLCDKAAMHVLTRACVYSVLYILG